MGKFVDIFRARQLGVAVGTMILLGGCGQDAPQNMDGLDSQSAPDIDSTESQLNARRFDGVQLVMLSLIHI